jgi:hypothetical protein
MIRDGRVRDDEPVKNRLMARDVLAEMQKSVSVA